MKKIILSVIAVIMSLLPCGGAEKLEVIPAAGFGEGGQGAFEVKFTPVFPDGSAKLAVGHIVNSRKWSKPQRGFSFGINRHADGKTFVWFYPVKDDGKVFGNYTAFPLVNGREYVARIVWTEKNFTVSIDGKQIGRMNIAQKITVGDKIEIGGMGKLSEFVKVRDFKIIVPRECVRQISGRGKVEMTEDAKKVFSFMCENPSGAMRLELRPQIFPVIGGREYFLDTTGSQGARRVRAVADGVLEVDLPLNVHNFYALSAAPENMLNKAGELNLRNAMRSGTTVHKFPPQEVAPGGKYLLSLRYKMLSGDYRSSFGMFFRILCNGKAVNTGNNRHYYSFPAYETPEESGRYAFEQIKIPAGKAGDKYTLETWLEVADEPSHFRIRDIFLGEEPQLAIHVGCLRGTRISPDIATIKAQQAVRKPIHVELRQDKGIPRMWCDGREEIFLPVMAESDEQLREAYAAGCRLFVVNLPINNWNNKKGSLWTGKDKYDFAVAKKILARVLEIAPESRIYVAFYGLAYQGFADDNPQSQWVDGSGRRGLWFFNTVPEKAYSLIGLDTRRLIGDFMFRFGSWLGKSELGKSVVAVQITGGSDGQWYPASHPWSMKNFDYSSDSCRAVGEQLRNFYRNDVAKLRQAWGDDKVEFEKITLPTPAEMNGDKMVSSRRVSDCTRAYAAALVAALDDLAGRFKAGFGRNLLATTYAPQNIIMDKTRLFGSKNLDGFVFLSAYLRPRSPGGSCETTHARSSAALHGKLLIEEVDFRNEYFGIRNFGMRRWYGMADSDAGYRGELLRNFAAAYADGNYAWLRPIGNDSYLAWTGYYRRHLSELLALTRNFMAVAKDDGESDVVWFAGDDYGAYWSNRGRYDHYMDYLGRNSVGLTRSGLRSSRYLLSDFGKKGVRKGRIYLFSCAASLSAEQTAYIRKNLQKDNNVLIFANDVGRSNAMGVTETVRQVAGMNVTMDMSVGMSGFYQHRQVNKLGITDMPTLGVWMRSLVFPRTEIDTTKGEILLNLESGAAGAVLRRHGNWSAVYIGGNVKNVTSAGFWRAMGKLAGVRPFAAEGDYSVGGNNIRMVHAVSSGGKQVAVGDASDVRDGVSGEKLPVEGGKVKFDLQYGETKVLLLYK